VVGFYLSGIFLSFFPFLGHPSQELEEQLDGREKKEKRVL
jgi:hypothetical protein